MFRTFDTKLLRKQIHPLLILSGREFSAPYTSGADRSVASTVVRRSVIPPGFRVGPNSSPTLLTAASVDEHVYEAKCFTPTVGARTGQQIGQDSTHGVHTGAVVHHTTFSSFYSAPQCSLYSNSVRLSVCLSHAGIVTKRLHV